MVQKLLAEFIGIFFLTFVGAGAICAGGDLIVVAAAHGLALAMAVYATGHISGGHLNPAVTIAMIARGKIKAPDGIGYIVAQLAGAAFAAFLVSQFFPDAGDPSKRLGATLGALSKPETQMTVLGIEIVLTFFLLTTIFAVAVDDRGPKNVYGFAIGLTVAFDILCAGPLSGASMNPARSFGPAVVGGHWDIHWVYWAGPIAGALIGAFLYDLVFIGKKEADSA